MKINQKTKKNHKITLIISLILLAILLGGSFWLYDRWQDNKRNNQNPIEQIQEEPVINYEPPTEEEIQTGVDIKNNHQQEKEITNSPNLFITATNIIDDQLQIGTLITDIISDKGTCQLTLQNSAGQTKEFQAKTAISPSSSLCEGFSIDTKDLSPGKWTIKLVVIINDQTLTTTKEIEL